MENTANDFLSVSDIHGKRVYDANGNDCGHVTSLLFDAQDTQLLFALIKLEDDVESHGSTAIPWNSVNLNPNTGDVMLKMNKDMLLDSPRLGKSDFKLSNDEGFLELLKYHGYSSRKLDPDSPTARDVRENYHMQNEGEEYTGSPFDNEYRNKMGEELDFDKIKGNKGNEQ